MKAQWAIRWIGLAPLLALAAAGCGSRDPDLLMERGVRAYTAGRYKAAARALSRAVRIEPRHPMAQLWCGVAHWKAGQAKRAAVHFMAAAAMDPDNPLPLVGVAGFSVLDPAVASTLLGTGAGRLCLALGLVLGGMLEDNLRRGLILSRGSFTTFLSEPLTLVLLVMALIVVASALLPTINKRRDLLAEPVVGPDPGGAGRDRGADRGARAR